MKARSVGGGRRVLLEKYAFLKRGGKERGGKIWVYSSFLFSPFLGCLPAQPGPPLLLLPCLKERSRVAALAWLDVGGGRRKDGRKLCVCIYMYVSAGSVAAGPRERERERKGETQAAADGSVVYTTAAFAEMLKLPFFCRWGGKQEFTSSRFS